MRAEQGVVDEFDWGDFLGFEDFLDHLILEG